VTWQIATTIAIVATILSGGHSHAADSNVWEIWRNRSGWGDKDFGYVVLTGLTASLFSFSGYEAGAHMAEETRNASSSSPWGLVATTVTTSLVGLLYILGLLYSVPAEIGLFTTLTAYGGAGGAANAASLYAVATGNRVGLMLTNVLIANLFFAGVSSFTVTSRIGYAMARDGAFPYGKQLARIWSATKSPVGSVVLVFVTDCLLLLLPLTTIKSDYGPVAFYAVMSICVIGCACGSCMRVCVCARGVRCTRCILTRVRVRTPCCDTDQMSYCIPVVLRAVCCANTFVHGDFSLGRAGVPIAYVAGLWLFITSCFLFWPSSGPVDQYNVRVLRAAAHACTQPWQDVWLTRRALARLFTSPACHR
jgi:hypothetical protein